MTEKLESIHLLAEEILRDDLTGKLPLRYTNEDVLAAAIVFSHVMGSRFTHMMIDESVPLGISRHLAEHLGEEIKKTVKYATAVDVKMKEV